MDLLQPGRRLQNGCFLCGDIRGDPGSSGIALRYGNETLRRAMLWSDEDLYLTPAPGTLAVGYLILATFTHVNRFAEVTVECLERVDKIWQRVRTIGRERDLGSYVMYEHGGQSFRNRGAACIDHAHLHLAPSPDPGQVRRILSARFREYPLTEPQDLTTLVAAPPYICLFGCDFSCYYLVPEVESQLVRRILAWQWSIPHAWNWKHHSLAPNFQQTLSLFHDAFSS